MQDLINLAKQFNTLGGPTAALVVAALIGWMIHKGKYRHEREILVVEKDRDWWKARALLATTRAEQLNETAQRALSVAEKTTDLAKEAKQS